MFTVAQQEFEIPVTVVPQSDLDLHFLHDLYVTPKQPVTFELGFGNKVSVPLYIYIYIYIKTIGFNSAVSNTKSLNNVIGAL